MENPTNNTITTTIDFEIDPVDLSDAEKVFNEEGLTLSEGIRKFLIHVKHAGCYPWVVKDDFYSSPETLAALREAEEILNDPNRKGFRSVEELFADLNSDDDDE